MHWHGPGSLTDYSKMRSSLLGTIWLFLAVLMVTVYGKSEQKGNKKRNGQDDESEDDKFNDYEVYQTIENMRKLTGHDNFYDLLGIGTSANDEQIGRAFRKLSVKYHPDKHGKEMEPMFKLVQYVGTLLRDAKRRARYEWLMHEAPAWHRESVYAVRRMHKVNKISMRQFWMFTFGFLIFGQLVAQWITYILKAGRVKMARRNLQAMGDKEVKRIRKKLESGMYRLSVC